MYKLIRSGLNLKKVLNNSCGKNWVLSIRAEVDGAEENNLNPEKVDPNIFVFQINIWNEDAGDMFVDVADVHDLNLLPLEKDVTLPLEHPVEDHIPYYRKSEVTLDCYTADEAEEIWEKVKQRVRALVRESEAAKRLEKKEEYRA